MWIQWTLIIFLLCVCSVYFAFSTELKDLWCAIVHRRYHRRMEIPRDDVHSIKHEGKVIGRRKTALKKSSPLVIIACSKCKTYFKLNKDTNRFVSSRVSKAPMVVSK